jgi:4-aminobutyrate---pyruvate transaminase
MTWSTRSRRIDPISRSGPVITERGEGVYVFDTEGKRYIEGLAGLWSVAVGFGEERLVAAATRH